MIERFTNDIADASYILNYYLYGQATLPSELEDGSLIRDAAAESTMAVTGSSYMAKNGRFALASTFDVVEKFFSNSVDVPPKYDVNGNITFYTELEVRALMGVTEAIRTVRQYEYVDGRGDYAERTLLWNSMAYEIADTSRFWVSANGERSISEFAVIPFGNDNFDLESDSIPTQVLNVAYLKDRLDPFGIGRKVNVQISDDIDRVYYTRDRFLADTIKEGSWSYPTPNSAFVAVDGLINQLHQQNIISPVDADGRAIVYGTTADDVLKPSDLENKPLYDSDAVVGIGFVGGSGTDTVDYGLLKSTISIRVDGDQILVSRSGKIDELHGIEQIYGTEHRDLITIVGDIAANSSLTIDANGGQTPNPSDTIHVKAAASAVHLTLGSDGNGSLVSTATNGRIELVGFHTGIIGSDYDDVITDLSGGHKQIDGGGGDDTITVGGDGAIIMGGDGNDTLTGGDGNDVIDGGWGETNVLSGGGGSDHLVARGYNGADAADQLFGGSGADFLQASSGRAFMEGGAGNDYIDPGSTSSIINFSATDGHDYVVSSDRASFTINMSGISKYDVSFVITGGQSWSYGEPPNGSPIDIRGTVSFHGDLTVLVRSTGATITIEGPGGWGEYYDYTYDGLGDIAYLYPNTWSLQFADGKLEKSDFQDGGRSSVVFGDTSAYTTALSEYQAAVAPPAADTTGTEGNDNLRGGIGDDTISGGAGDDEIVASGGVDQIDGGEGYDSVVTLGSSSQFFGSIEDGALYLSDGLGSEGRMKLTSVEAIHFLGDGETSSVLVGTDQSDVLQGYGSAIIYGAAGDDVIGVEGGAAQLFGGAGNDLITGGVFGDLLVGGEGSDELRGGAGDDSYVWSIGDGDDVIVDSGQIAGFDTLSITDIASSDVRLSSDGSDLIIKYAGSGESIRLVGQLSSEGSGADYVYLANGLWTRQSIEERLHRVLVNGTEGNDGISGTELSDLLIGGSGNDRFSQSAGDDVYLWNRGDGNDLIERHNLVQSYDTTSLNIALGAGITTHDVSVHWRSLGDRTLSVFVASGGGIDVESVSNNIDSRISLTFADGTEWSQEYLINLATSTAPIFTGTSGNDEITGTDQADTINGLGGDDILTGASDDDIIYGNMGNDLIQGGYGNDHLYGGQGDDKIWGGSGDDYIEGGKGVNSIYGGDGFDTIGYVNAASGVTVSLMLQSPEGSTEVAQATGIGTDYIHDIENILGGSFNDVLTGDNTANTMWAGDGSDVLSGLYGNDLIYGENGNDTLFGNQGRDLIYGGVGDDIIYGGQGDDTLFGDEGNDTLVGGVGGNTLAGGAGQDVFVISLDSSDIVIDFAAAAGDKIDLRAIDANKVNGAGMDHFVFSSLSYFTGVTSELIVIAVADGSQFAIQGDTNGDGEPDFQVFVVTPIAPNADAFILA